MPYLKDRYLRTVSQMAGKISSMVFKPVVPLKIKCYVTAKPVDFSHRTAGEALHLREGDRWGRNLFDCGWFHFTGTVPAACEGKRVALLIDVSGEGLIVDQNGEPAEGVTCVDSQFDPSLGKPGKWVYLFQETGKPGSPVDIWMDAGLNDLFGVVQNQGRIQVAQIGVWNTRLFNLLHDMIALIDYLKCSNSKSARYNQILFSLYNACIQLTSLDDGGYDALEATARQQVSLKGGEEAPLSFTAIGHAHTDLAWLWPIRETKRKTARTFATALAMMDRYPDYVFGASQPQQFQWLKEDYPGLYRRVKEKVREGRFEVQGCMWVEADTNLSGGEALVRQILYGKKFFMDEFGVDARVLWLPDVFGYSAAIPQILIKSGCTSFMTQKLSWSLHNKFPHQSFRWQGIDGTEIFTHMLPEDTYNSTLLPKALRTAEENYIDNGVCDEALILFGIGDGGGGPGMEHLEAAKRVQNFYGLCPCRQGQAQSMLERLRDRCWDRIPRWSGELYLERHQGTYTTSSRSKRMNRLMESALRELEFVGILSGDTPKDTLDRLWKETLLYQFHDILPGSSIQRVYDESLKRYAAMLEETQALIADRYVRLAGPNAAVFNSLSWPRQAILKRDDGFYRVSVPSLGYTCERGEKIDASSVSARDTTLENRYLKAVFNQQGELVSCFDKRNGREAIKAPSNRYALYTEENADCWDIAIEYTDRVPEHFTLVSQVFRTEGFDAVCRQEYAYGASAVSVRIRLGEDMEYLTFDAKIDWQESGKMLRTSFDTTAIADRAGFDIQFGLLHRSNNENTLWDKAQFEQCGHKWVDLSEGGWGVALLNDCKYGFRVKGGVLDMNILRAQHYPSDFTDRGEHTLSYALYPHTGNEKGGLVKEKAYEFNIPLRFTEGEFADTRACLIQAVGVIVESVKQAENGEGTILRVYEPYGSHEPMRIGLSGAYQVTPCDLMENAIGESYLTDTIQQDIKPFEILSFRLQGKP